MRKFDSGFTAVEVLVTLFIATTVLAGGYQAYSAVVNSTGSGRERAVASNIAYTTLRREASKVPQTCSSQSVTVLPNTIPADTKLPTPYKVTEEITCPYGTSSPISLVKITLTYGSDNQKVTHGIYAR